MPSLLEAIEKKYGDDWDSFDKILPAIAIFVPPPRDRLPPLLVFNDCSIDSAGNPSVLQDKCSGVRELDLAQNCLTQWSEVLCILRQMPMLKFANLSFNLLTDSLQDKICDNFPLLTNVVLNNTQIDWPSVRHLLNILPSLEELHLSLNNFNRVDLDDDLSDEPSVRHKNLKKLHFTGNPVSEWCEICKLGRAFPNLEMLVVADCPLSSLDPSSPCSSPERSGNSLYSRSESECEGSPRRNSPHDNFRQLRFLNLNGTLLSEWEDVERLGRFPALHCLRIQSCPLFEEYTEHERRQLLIARLPNIQTLNGGGVIQHEEREDAERAFIRYYMDKPESDRPERYSDLVSIHGRLEPLVNIDLSPERVVKVNVTCGQNTELKSINVYQTVQELKQKLEAYSKIPVAKMRLFYVDQDMASLGPEELRFPNKQIYSYNICSGDEIIVDSKI